MALYDVNMQWLQRRDNRLAERIYQGESDLPVVLRKSKTGMPIAVVQQNGQALALNHPDDPVQHMQEYLENARELREARGVILLGSSLGYAPLMVTRLNPYLRHLYVLEPSISVFRAALQSLDLSPLFQSGNVHFVVGSEPGAVYQAVLQNLMDLMANTLSVIECPSITSLFPNWSAGARKQIQEALRLGQSGLVTKFKDGPLTLGNLLKNLPTLLDTPGLSEAEGKFKNVPAVVVAAGPSLAKNVSQLKGAQKNCLIIATDTAHPVLLKNGITPHFVITVDPTELNLRHFSAEKYSPETVLLFDPEGRPEVPAKFPQKLTFMTDKHPFFGWLDRQMGGKGTLKKGGMVSQAGLQAALFMGCSPVILVGQDLALDPKTCTTHAPDTALCRKVTFPKGDSDTVEIATPDQPDAPVKEKIYWVDGVNGDKVPTVQSFLVYIHMLEDDIRKTATTIIDATEGGAKIEGTVIQTLAETLKKEAKPAVNVPKLMAELAARMNAYRPQAKIDIPAFLRTLLKKRVSVAREGMELLQKSPDATLPQLESVTERYRRDIFSDPLAEYIIEYAAPRELFDFLKLGPANADLAHQIQAARNRFSALLDAATAADDRLRNWL